MKRGHAISMVLVITGLLSGCGSPPAAKAQASGSVSPSPDATSLESATPAASATTSQALSCKLPVVTESDAGWITFPAGTYKPDPKADVHLPISPSVVLSKSYDKAFERWLAVPRDWISPDGKHYAYPDVAYPGAYLPGGIPSGGIHVVDLPSGTNHFFDPGKAPTDSTWSVLDYETEGVYFAYLPNGPSAPTGVWLLNPATGTSRKISDFQSEYIGGGAAWGTSDAITGHGPGPGSRLLRMDLKTGAVVSWYKRTDVEFVVAGGDPAGHPILQVTTLEHPQLLLITGSNAATILFAAPGSSVPTGGNFIHPVSDTHGIWFGDTNGTVSLYTTATGITKMAQVGSGVVGIGGGCH